VYGYGYEIIPVTRWGWGWEKSLIPVGFKYGDGDEFFMRGWVWDSETRPRPAPLPSLIRPKLFFLSNFLPLVIVLSHIFSKEKEEKKKNEETREKEK